MWKNEVRELRRVFSGGVKIQDIGLHPGALEGQTEDIRAWELGRESRKGKVASYVSGILEHR